MRSRGSLAAAFLGLALCFVVGCSGSGTSEPRFFAEQNPEWLSAWGQLSVRGDWLELDQAVEPYTLNTPLFTDYALKLRTLWLPAGQTARAQVGAVLELPVGTVITKTFYYPRGATLDAVLRTDRAPTVHAEQGLDLARFRPLETRLLVHRSTGWVPLSYVWRGDGSDARLRRTGAMIPLTLHTISATVPRAESFDYIVPSEAECAGCHQPNATAALTQPLGPSPRQLNRDYRFAAGSVNQLTRLVDRGWLASVPDAVPAFARWDDDSASLEARARAYLDSNCGHCHNSVGPADTSGLHLNFDNDSAAHLGWCKNAVAAGSGTGGRRFDLVPGDADGSILVYRMASREPAAMMPELGRSLAHAEGVALIRAWVDATSGACTPTQGFTAR